MLETLGASHNTTTTFQPQANCLVKRIHRQLKGVLRACLDGPEGMDELPLVLLGIQAAWREGTDTSAFEVLYGVALSLPGKFIAGTEARSRPQMPMSATSSSG